MDYPPNEKRYLSIKSTAFQNFKQSLGQIYHYKKSQILARKSEERDKRKERSKAFVHVPIETGNKRALPDIKGLKGTEIGERSCKRLSRQWSKLIGAVRNRNIGGRTWLWWRSMWSPGNFKGAMQCSGYERIKQWGREGRFFEKRHKTLKSIQRANQSICYNIHRTCSLKINSENSSSHCVHLT